MIDFTKDRVTVRNFGLPPSKKKKKNMYLHCLTLLWPELADDIKRRKKEVCGRSKEFSEECFYQNDNW